MVDQGILELFEIMIESNVLSTILHHLRNKNHLILFLDYDGTLLPIAPTPAEAQPDQALLELLTKLTQTPLIQTIVLSGRPLKSLQAMLPIRGLVLAGTYGAEIQKQDEIITRGIAEDRSYSTVVQIRNEWSRLIKERAGFLLEDKGITVALHARWAEANEAKRVLKSARRIANKWIDSNHMRILDGHRFLEVVPSTADKGQAVDWFLARNSEPHSLPVYFGDDDKDERAFTVIRRWGGFSIGVDTRYPLLQADEHLTSSDSVRAWLVEMIITAR